MISLHHAMKAEWGNARWSVALATTELDGDRWQTSRPDRFTPTKVP